MIRLACVLQSQTLRLPSDWSRRLSLHLENRFHDIAAARRLRAEHRRNRRHWSYRELQACREARIAQALQRVNRAKRFWTWKNLGILSVIALVLWTVSNDVSHPQITVTSYDVVGGPPGLDKNLAKLLRHRFEQILARDESAPANSDFLMVGRELDFHVFGIDGSTLQTAAQMLVHAIEHLLKREPPEVSGTVTIATNKEGKPFTMFTLDIAAGGRVLHNAEVFMDSTDVSEIADRIAKEVLYRQDPYLLAVFYYRNDKLNDAAKVIRERCLGNPNLAGSGHLLLGRILNDWKDSRGALGQLCEAIEFGRQSNAFASAAKGGMARAYITLSDQERDKGHDPKPALEKALKAAQEAIDLNPANARPELHRGNAFMKLGRIDEALACFQRANKKAPKFSTPFKRKGDAFEAEKDYPHAISAYEKAIQLNAKEPDVHFRLAEIYEKQQEYDSAIHTYEGYLYTFAEKINEDTKLKIRLKIESLQALQEKKLEPTPPTPLASKGQRRR